MTDRELMQQALSVLCNNVYPRDGVRDNRHLTPKSHAEIYQQTVDALFDRLAQPERQWVGLTDDEIALIVGECAASHRHDDFNFARAIETKLKEKNE
jgi:hypothetical protein